VESSEQQQQKSIVKSITINNLAIVKHATISDLSPSLTVVTGETGAGKSLVTSAISLACGDAVAVDHGGRQKGGGADVEVGSSGVAWERGTA